MHPWGSQPFIDKSHGMNSQPVTLFQKYSRVFQFHPDKSCGARLRGASSPSSPQPYELHLNTIQDLNTRFLRCSTKPVSFPTCS